MPVISNNAAANTALLYLNKNQAAETNSLAKLSSGNRIVKASDDAAGLAVSDQLQSDITVLKQASTNTQQAQSVLNTADGALSNISDILQRMKSLAAEAQSGSIGTSSYTDINTEYQQLLTEIGTIVTATSFNGVALIDGSYNQDFLIGTNASTDTISADLSSVDATATGLGINSTDVTSSANAATASAALDTAIQDISTYRSTVGALESRFNFQSDVINTRVDALESAKSAITDTDIAAEQTNYTNEEVKTQTAIAALAQANQMNAALLKLVQ